MLCAFCFPCLVRSDLHNWRWNGGQKLTRHRLVWWCFWGPSAWCRRSLWKLVVENKWSTQRKRLTKTTAVSITVIQVAFTCIFLQTFFHVAPLLFITHSSYLISQDLSGVSEDMPYITHQRLLNETVLSFRPNQLAANIWSPTSAYIHERLFFSHPWRFMTIGQVCKLAQSSALRLSISED